MSLLFGSSGEQNDGQCTGLNLEIENNENIVCIVPWVCLALHGETA